MAQIVAHNGEGFDSLLRRFNKKVQADGILSEARRRAHYQKPATRRKRKAAARIRQAIKAAKRR